jgi:hypothetical protein
MATWRDGCRRKASNEWVNGSGSLRFAPASIERPRDEAELTSIVRRAAREGHTVRDFLPAPRP